MPRVFIPPTLRSLVDGRETVDVPGSSVREIIDELDAQFPGVRQRLRDDEGLRPGVAVAIGGSVSSLGLLQRVGPQDEVHFLPAIGGG
jgi:molybdopterin synthase sulfur carrier subunit